MINAMNEISEKLSSTGMSQEEIDHLLAAFLEEEAFKYVDYISCKIMDMQEKAWNTESYS